MNDTGPHRSRQRNGMCAVVPVKMFGLAKERLGSILSRDQRGALTRAMLEDVLLALTRAPSLDGIAVVTGDAAAAAIARAAGALVIADAENAGTTAAVTAAARHLERSGRRGMLVIPADVPWITSEDVESILAAHRPAPAVTLVPASNDGGTNALACSPLGAIAFSFGEDSFRRHCEAARTRGIEPGILEIERIGHDIDRPGDLASFLRRPSLTQTHALLARIRFSERLQHMRHDRPGEPRLDPLLR